MKLVSDIINELVDSEKSISGPLMKTKVLASQIKNSELLSWVNNELNGYSTNKVPEYRSFVGIPTMDYINGRAHFKNQSIPISAFSEELEEGFTALSLKDGVASLEAMQRDNNKSQSIGMKFPAEVVSLIQYKMEELGNRHIQVISAKKELPITVVTETLFIIRSKLLDFMLAIDEEYGNKTEIELKSLNQQIANIMNTTINNNGDGNVSNTGTGSTITANIQIIKYSKEELQKALSKNGVAKEDIIELATIVDTEKPDLEKGSFGTEVNGWMHKMIGKAIDGSWEISIAAAGGLLVEIIKAYYGMK